MFKPFPFCHSERSEESGKPAEIKATNANGGKSLIQIEQSLFPTLESPFRKNSNQCTSNKTKALSFKNSALLTFNHFLQQII
ncbi:MAG TPA: hypothetical protein VGO09_09510 [Flavisolibacter sp.]|nr:hypothetical protein [Flavisolibacter sp.]